MKLRVWLVGQYQELVAEPYCVDNATKAVTVNEYLCKAKEKLNHPWLRSTIGHNIVAEIEIIYKLLLAQDSISACQTKDAIVRLHMVKSTPAEA